MFGLNKYIVYGIFLAIAIGIFSTFVLMWKSAIENKAILEANNKQLKQVVADQQKFLSQMADVNALQQIIIESLNKKNEDLKRDMEDVKNFLASADAVKEDRPSSRILRETVRRIKK